jgi:hypothetical protein
MIVAVLSTLYGALGLGRLMRRQVRQATSVSSPDSLSCIFGIRYRCICLRRCSCGGFIISTYLIDAGLSSDEIIQLACFSFSPLISID